MRNLSLLLVIAINLLASEKRELPVFLNSITIGSYHSLGFSDMVSTSSSEISSANPASLANFSSLSLGATFEYWTKTDYDYYYELEHKRPKQWLPAAFGVVYPYKNFSLAAAYCQKYTNFIDMSDIPNASLLYKNLKSETIIHSPSSMFSYTQNHILTENDRLSFAVQLFLDFFKETTKVSSREITITGNDLSWKIGALYQLNNAIGIGMFYEKGVDIEGTAREENDIDIVVPIDTNSSTQLTKINPVYIFKLPDKLAIGLSLRSIENFRVSITLASIFWKQISDDYQNQLDISVGGIYALLENLDLSLGLYKTNQNMSDYAYYSRSVKNATFINGGIRYKIGNLSCRIEVTDSHLFTSEFRKKTIFTLGADYIF